MNNAGNNEEAVMQIQQQNQQSPGLVWVANKVRRVVRVEQGTYRVLMPFGSTHYPISHAHPLDAKPWQMAFDEWQNLPLDVKVYNIACCMRDNPDQGWREETISRIQANMPVFDHVVRVVCERVRSYCRHYSCRTIFEVARYNTDLQMIGSNYKIDNNLIPDVSRIVALMFPEVPEGFFEFRNVASRSKAQQEQAA